MNDPMDALTVEVVEYLETLRRLLPLYPGGEVRMPLAYTPKTGMLLDLRPYGDGIARWISIQTGVTHSYFAHLETIAPHRSSPTDHGVA